MTVWPKIIDIPLIGIPINTYGVAIMAGFLLAVYIWLKRVKERGFSPDFALDVAILVMISGLLGGKLAAVITSPGSYASQLQIFNVFDGRLASMGSLFGIIPLLVFLYKTRDRQVNFISHLRSLSLWTLACAAVGMRVLYVAKYPAEFRLEELLNSWRFGFALYGGLIVGTVAGVWYARRKGQPALKLLDIAAPAILLGIAVGRLGCFASGCCFGKQCDLPICVSFPKGDAHNHTPVFDHHLKLKKVTEQDQHSKPVLPTQLFETLACVIGFFLLSGLWRRRKFDGAVITAMGVYYSVWRFINEFLRDDPERLTGSILGLTWPQEVSIAVAAFSIYMCFYFKNRAAVSAQPA